MKKILVVDDDPDVIDASRIVLEKAGFEVHSASSRLLGMKAVVAQKPDVIILDVMMDEPDDGFHLAQDLRAAHIDTPILMMTSIGRVTGFSFGIDDELLPVNDFLEKPATPDKLLAVVHRLLNTEKGGR
ncbi:MAG: response regulator [Deltaproteobacteria bacterium]|nr:response regulator [Deltaproteobacteria bacterium]